MLGMEVITSEHVLEALRIWHGSDVSKWPLAHLRLGLQVAQNEAAYGTLAEAGPAARNRGILTLGLDVLRGMVPEAESLLRERYEHRRDVMAVANRLNVSESSLYYRQRQAINLLTDILVRLEEKASNEWLERMISRLGVPSYARLVGVEASETAVSAALINETEHFIVSLDGLGGLGKTALADHIARSFVSSTRFEEIAWVTAKHTHLSTMGRLQVESGRPALTFNMLVDQLANQFDLSKLQDDSQLQRQRLVKHFLRSRACLVVIDNLETAADYHNLLPELRKWQQPTKFLLTSRLRLLDEPGVFSFSLQELPETAAFELIRMEAARTGFAALQEAPDEELKEIYQIIGGNPLALKLVVGQLRFHSLSRVLKRFSTNRHQNKDEGIFDYIYREFWEGLGDSSKTALLALTQAGETGFTFEHLLEVVQLPEEVLEQCLEELVLLSLVDLAGSLKEKRYRLHRLTEAFLLRMIDEP